MEQRIPDISDADIKRIIIRDFPKSQFIEIEDILGMYKSKSKKGKNRIYASILKLSGGDIDLLKKYVKEANDDYRNIIAASEYPNYSECVFEYDLTEEKKKQLIKDDWIQYQAWLNKV